MRATPIHCPLNPDPPVEDFYYRAPDCAVYNVAEYRCLDCPVGLRTRDDPGVTIITRDELPPLVDVRDIPVRHRPRTAATAAVYVPPVADIPSEPAGSREDLTGPVRQCRECGCTDDDCHQCVERTGAPCHWAEEDLCSACEALAVIAAASARLDAKRGAAMSLRRMCRWSPRWRYMARRGRRRWWR